MRTDVGTWRDGRLKAMPHKSVRSSILDPTDPANKEVVYLMNPKGVPSAVQKWLAFDILNDPVRRGKGWEETTQEVYEEHLRNHKDPVLDKYHEKMIKENQPVTAEKFEQLEGKVDKMVDMMSKILETKSQKGRK